MVKIITDSAADFESYELINNDIVCIPMNISFGENEYQENVNITKEEFYNLLETSNEFPKTSQPSVYEFEKMLKSFKENGDECVIITISSSLSGTYQNAMLTKNTLEYEECYVIDSLTATAGERILVDEAVKLRKSGKSAREIAETLEIIKGRVTLKACIDTLEYLYKGGRLSKAAYTVGSMVNIKPIIELTQDGKVELSSKALSIRQGIKSICDSFINNEPDTRYPIYIVYSHNRKNADILAKKINELGYDIPDERIINIGATIGAHIGKNACGYIYIGQQKQAI